MLAVVVQTIGVSTILRLEWLEAHFDVSGHLRVCTPQLRWAVTHLLYFLWKIQPIYIPFIIIYNTIYHTSTNTSYCTRCIQLQVPVYRTSSHTSFPYQFPYQSTVPVTIQVPVYRTSSHTSLPYRLHPFTIISNLSGWWFQPLWKILVNGKDYPIFYGKYWKIKLMFQTTNQIISNLILFPCIPFTITFRQHIIRTPHPTCRVLGGDKRHWRWGTSSPVTGCWAISGGKI